MAIRSDDKRPRKGTVKCGNCGEVGHNRKGCDQPINVIPPKDPGRPRKDAKDKAGEGVDVVACYYCRSTAAGLVPDDTVRCVCSDFSPCRDRWCKFYHGSKPVTRSSRPSRSKCRVCGELGCLVTH